ncbi:putative MATE family efflux protein [Breznakia sp. PF5-3]|uniref:MATE family efflux transporter n=1 Tax=unclassified Breznakia TaxID=2623764 RepID=UPI00240664A8|nr:MULTISPECIES: MATE family efflux transporter [unclassified Breznakia]MDF9825683.1 putative MATE family efflux protein [Breznakia sp. PM6-1]MDF9836064.1 putative MATE family efflux protein [Breznakia sp. PF5-3]MDF9838283.1 putative MATE family efflux protein [Breznakia sp. PFB2-8]MDF9860321.1 putative MATE family efflux protein [Breznakia sp. PH5-24]
MQENKMGTMPINRLLITMSLPMMVSMLIQALYNIVDSAFVAQISEDALTAVSLAYPIQNLMIAIATGTGVGINALLSRYLGRKSFDKANRVASSGVLIMFISSLLFLVFGLLGSEYYFSIQNTSSEIAKLGTKYLQICTIFGFGIFLEIAFERLLQATGRTLYTMCTQGLGAIINIILDPLFIFGYGFIPAMGIEGAAIATITGQIIAAILALFFNLKFNHDVDFNLRKYKPDLHIIRKIYGIGFPSIIMVSIGSIMSFGMNQILMSFTKSAAAFFGGVYIKLQGFIFMPIFGLNNGIIPIVSYNYGARNQQRITQTIRLGCIYAVVIMSLGVLLFQLFPDVLLGFFSPSKEMLKIGVIGLRIISVHFVLAAVSIVLSTTFQALGHGMLSLFSSVIRQLVVLLPAAYLLAQTQNVHMVWFAFPIAEVVSLGLCIYLFYKIYHSEIAILETEK